MKELQNDFTTPEQSKRLLEFGVPAESSNLYYFDLGSGFVNAPDLREYKENWSDCRYLPCWSAGRLIEIYNECCEDKAPLVIGKYDIPIQRVLIEFFAALKYGWIDFSKLEE